MRGFRFVLSLLSVLSVGSVFAADSAKEVQFSVPEIIPKELSWGKHVISVKIINNGEYLKYITVASEVKCRGLKLNPERIVNKNFAIFPGDTVISEIALVVPGSYGDFTYDLKLYDVVDTVDDLLESQVIERQGGTFNIAVSDDFAQYVKKGITMPPLVGRHIDFDNDFSHVLPFLISSGRTVSEISKMAGCDSSFVLEELDYMVSRRYYLEDSGHYYTSIVTINEEEAIKGKILALKVAESLAAKMADNIKTYKNVLDSLIKGEFLTPDSNSFMDGGAVMYKPYPVITALSLWYDLGSSFVRGDSVLNLFDGTDLCNGYIPNYLYAVAGGPENNGKHFFAFMRNFRSYQIYFGDTIPEIICPEGFMFSPQAGVNVVWNYVGNSYPEGFVVDTLQVRPMLNHLRRGTDPVLKDAFEKLSAIGKQHSKTSLQLGQRYWFWNLVATRTVEILTANGTITRRGNGQIRLDGMSAK